MVCMFAILVMLFLLIFMALMFILGGAYAWALLFPASPAWIGSIVVLAVLVLGFALSMFILVHDSIDENQLIDYKKD